MNLGVPAGGGTNSTTRLPSTQPRLVILLTLVNHEPLVARRSTDRTPRRQMQRFAPLVTWFSADPTTVPASLMSEALE
jgi:hypothetical protein